ncbi:Altered inheritance of mitochondria protein 18 mitochondrial [Naganishia albida]|nr:Altered inheritance of mitochondria protein 18 mitochondrial [Naganishia albida]
MPPKVPAFQQLLRTPVALAVARRRLPTYGVALTTGIALTWYMYELQLRVPQRLTVYADSEQPSRILDTTIVKDAFVVDNATSIQFPQTLRPLALSNTALSLVGLGVRTVSFLRVKVYSAAFYLEESALGALRGQAEWSSFTADRLTKATATGEGELVGEALMHKLLSQPINCAIRIVPTRKTDFGHLRDGFTRALQARQKKAAKDGKLSAEEEERIDSSIQQFKSFFPSSSVPKGKELLLVKTAQNSLAVEFEGKTLGTLRDAWVATEMMVAYFADRNVISAPLKEDVARKLESTIRGV